MRLIDLDLLNGKIAAMQACEPNYAFHFLNDAQNPSTEWECVEDMIENMPVIKAQPTKYGKWSECWRDQVRNVISVICSECGNASITCLPITIFDDDDLLKKICIQMPYCPKCGAEMRGEDYESNS